MRVVGEFVVKAWGPLPGIVQCIDAAEVHAVTRVLRLGVPPLHVYSDSDFFVKGWERGQVWCEAPGRAHADVWREFWAVLNDFGVEALQVTKVKAHATQAMVEGNVISEIDRWGNQVADDAAKKGAACHPSLDEFLKQLEAQRELGKASLRWMGVGLEAAQRAGALPEALTDTQKADRPRQVQLKRVEVIKDDTWRSEHCGKVITEGAHPSHAMNKCGQYFFCSACGHHGAQRLVALSGPCPRTTTPSRKFLLKRLLGGLHPRTGEPLGAVERVGGTAGSSGDVGFSASSRRRNA